MCATTCLRVTAVTHEVTDGGVCMRVGENTPNPVFTHIQDTAAFTIILTHDTSLDRPRLTCEAPEAESAGSSCLRVSHVTRG